MGRGKDKTYMQIYPVYVFKKLEEQGLLGKLGCSIDYERNNITVLIETMTDDPNLTDLLCDTSSLSNHVVRWISRGPTLCLLLSVAY